MYQTMLCLFIVVLLYLIFLFFFFFFQAEDGIRDLYVTGVQTCALPIFGNRADLIVLDRNILDETSGLPADARVTHTIADRKSTRLNSSHVEISYAVFCLKKKKKKKKKKEKKTEKHEHKMQEQNQTYTRI